MRHHGRVRPVKKFRPFIFILALFAVFPATPQAEYHFLGPVTGVDVLQDGLQLRCGEDLVRIQVVGEGMVRVRLGVGGKFLHSHSYAVLAEKRNLPRWNWNDFEDRVTLYTDSLIVEVHKNPCRISFFDGRKRLLNRDEPAFGMAWNGDEVVCFKELRPEEKFFGLGEKTGSLNKRGNFYSMWNSDVPGYRTNQDPLYQSHPFFMGLTGSGAYGIFFDNSYRSHFNLGASNDRFYSFGAEGGELDYYFLAGPTPRDVLRRYTELVGRMPLPPLWALGYQQCRWSYYPEAEVRRITRTFREKQIPCDVIYLDIHYMDGYRVFTWNPQRFRHPKRLLSDLEAEGFKVVTIIDPGVKDDPGYKVDRSGLQGGHFVKYPDGKVYRGQVWPGWSHFPDFTRPATRTWWGNWFRDMLQVGVDGFWLDMNEPSVWGQAFPDLVQFDDEGHRASHKKIHNVYGLEMARATYEGLLRIRPNERPFLLTRAGFSGVHRYAAVWTGDNVASFQHLELGIVMCQNMSVSEIPFVGTDVGGFAGTPTPELFARWIEFGAFTPFFRTHTSYNTPSQEPWSFGDDVEAISRRYISLRYRLLPYTYTAFFQTYRSGVPVMRPLFLDYWADPQSLSWTGQREYFWGDDLLVAPVFRQGAKFREVYLPEGRWFGFWNSRKYSGRQSVTVKTPLDVLPLFVRAGAMLPSRRTIQYVGEAPLDTLIWLAYPGKQMHGQVYLDDGKTLAYRRGEFRLDRWRGSFGPGKAELHFEHAEGKGSTSVRGQRIVFRAVSRAPVKLIWNGKVLPGRKQAGGHPAWRYDAEEKTLTTDLPYREGELTIRWK